MRFLVRSREYRHPRAWVGFRFAAGVWNLVLGVLLLASFHWLGPLALLGAVPLAGAVLIFWTAYRLQQDSARRVRELEQSRTHVVDDSAARLRQIERDLHDGAQAQLVAVAMKLGLATKKLRGMTDGTGQTDLDRVLELVAAAHRGAKEAITELRDLARGIHPPVLDQGLGIALTTLAARSDLPVELVVDLPERPSAAIETIAYFCAAELLANVAKHSGARHATLEAVHTPGCCGCGSATTAAAAPASRTAAAWPGSPSGSGPWTAGCRSPARPGGPPWSPLSCRPTPDRTGAPMRIVIAEDSAVIRAGLAEILTDSDHEVVAAVGNADDLLAAVDEHRPDAAVVDVRMSPGYTDEGLRAAITIRRDHPETGVLVFSQYIETRYTADLLGAASGGGAAGVGYLLKDRVADVEEFVEALSRVAAGGTALDPEVITQLLRASRRTDGLGTLTARERDVLALMAEGRSNTAIAGILVVSEKSVEKHVGNIFSKLGLPPSDADHRRVLAVLRYLES
jgi:DNA-binding NarL/FixJ family response regulator